MGAPRRLHRPASTECATAVQRRRRRPPPASLRAYDLPGGQERQSTRRGAGARHAPRATCRRRSDQDAAPALDLARSHEISTQKPLHMGPRRGSRWDRRATAAGVRTTTPCDTTALGVHAPPIVRRCRNAIKRLCSPRTRRGGRTSTVGPPIRHARQDVRRASAIVHRPPAR